MLLQFPWSFHLSCRISRKQIILIRVVCMLQQEDCIGIKKSKKYVQKLDEFGIYFKECIFVNNINYHNQRMLAFTRNHLLYRSGFLHFMFASSKFQTYKDVKIPNSEMSKNFMRSSGPGGQSVNTTNSKAEIRILIKGSSVIDQFIANNLLQKYPNFINKQGQLFVRSQLHKSQNANVAECVIKLQKLIFNCSQVPQQRKYDIPPETEQEQEARIEQKRWRGDIKKIRRRDKRYT